MMQVRIVRMGVNEFLMAMPMTVRFARRIVAVVAVLMMFIVEMQMFVLHWLVMVFVFVVFSQVKPYAEGHQNGRRENAKRERLSRIGQRNRGSDEWCSCKIGTRSGRPDMPQRQHKESQTYPVAEKSNQPDYQSRASGRPLRSNYQSHGNIEPSGGKPF